jgi:enoyl-CoA hydratase/carnithine racemase
VVVAGEGRAFSSGLDTSLFGAQTNGVPVDISYLQDSFTVFEELPVPTVAAVRGPCLGGGLQLAIACDLRVAAPDASFSAFEVRWGIIPDLGGTQRLPRLVGLGRAKEMVLTARMVSGDEAFAWGLANRLVDAEKVLDEALGWARELAAGPPLALGAAKRLTQTAFDLPVRAGLRREEAAQRRMLASEDFREAVLAALEKRAPQFKAR